MSSAKRLRIFAFVLCIAGVVIAILNLKRVADLRMTGIPAFFIVIAAGLMAAARRRERERTKGEEGLHG